MSDNKFLACSVCGGEVYYCSDYACRCFHHCYTTFDGYHDTGCELEDISKEYTKEMSHEEVS